MLNKIMINAEMPTMNTEQLRELQDRVFLAINEAFKKQDAADLRYLQELELQIADRIDYLEF
jgi:aspartyl/asparaginyl-tRNA synthetase